MIIFFVEAGECIAHESKRAAQSRNVQASSKAEFKPLSKSKGSTVSAKEDREVGRKSKFDQRTDEAKDTKKASPTTPLRAMVNRFEILSTSATFRK